MHKQNPNKSNETQSNPRPNAHTRHNRKRDRKRKRECERSGSRGSDLWWLTEKFETVAMAIGSPSGGGNRFSELRWRRWEAAVAAGCWEWGFVWESREESDRSELQLRVRVFLLLRVSFSRVWCLRFSLFFYLFIYTKLRAAFHKMQLRMNWSCVLLNAAL